MKREIERIPASEYARQYGWRTSAVIQRIRSGIYDGVFEDGTWYVLSDVESSADRRIVGRRGAHEQTTDTAGPWSDRETLPGPLKWVTWVNLGFIALLLPIAWFDAADSYFWVVGLGMFIFGGSLLYEVYKTGGIRTQGFDKYEDIHPVMFWTLVAVWIAWCLTGLAGLIKSLIDLFGAA